MFGVWKAVGVVYGIGRICCNEKNWKSAVGITVVLIIGMCPMTSFAASAKDKTAGSTAVVQNTTPTVASIVNIKSDAIRGYNYNGSILNKLAFWRAYLLTTHHYY